MIGTNKKKERVKCPFCGNMESMKYENTGEIYYVCINCGRSHNLFNICKEILLDIFPNIKFKPGCATLGDCHFDFFYNNGHISIHVDADHRIVSFDIADPDLYNKIIKFINSIHNPNN